MNILQAKDLYYEVEDGQKKRVILDDININFEQGLFYTILGSSGSGKTTLLSLLSALDTPKEGEILLENRDIRSSGLSNYRRNKIGIVFQNFHLIPYMTGLENVLVAMGITNNKVGGKKEALQILSDLGIDANKANRSVTTLSGGEQQRVAIARALSTGVDIILADEPTGNLDHKTQKGIIEVFKNLAHEQGKCVIVVSHSNEVAQASDTILRLHDGVLTDV